MGAMARRSGIRSRSAAALALPDDRCMILARRLPRRRRRAPARRAQDLPGLDGRLRQWPRLPGRRADAGDWPDDALTMSVRRGPEAARAAGRSPSSSAPTAMPAAVERRRQAAGGAAGRRRGATRVAAGRHGGDDRRAALGRRGFSCSRRDGRAARHGLAQGRERGLALHGRAAAPDRHGHRAGAARRPGRPRRPPPPPLPVVAAPAAVAARGRSRSSAAAHRALRSEAWLHDRRGRRAGRGRERRARRAGETLLLLACGSGAYNVSHVPFVAPRRGGASASSSPPFDVEARLVGGGGQADPGQRRLGQGARPADQLLQGPRPRRLRHHREYAWDGAPSGWSSRRRWASAAARVDYITTWRARVVRQ